jgi:hypothetical protein
LPSPLSISTPTWLDTTTQCPAKVFAFLFLHSLFIFHVSTIAVLLPAIKMMPSLVGASMVGAPHSHGSGAAYTVDTILNELSKQLIGNTRRYSRASNGQQQRVGNAMRISKPGSASNSPRSSTMQARRRTLIGDGFWGGLQTPSPAMEQMYQPSPAPETPSESFYERETTRSARPVSWHPSSQNAQQSLYSQQESSNAMFYPYSMYSDAEILASLQQYPPTPAAYSGYTSPAESFSPLSLPYSNYNSQQMCSPQQQQQQQQTPAAFHPGPCSSNYPSANTLSDIPYLPPPHVADESLSWDAYSGNNALLSQHTAPPTPEDFAYNVAPPQQQQQQQQQPQQPAKQEATQQAYQPLIHDDDAANESEGEILYGMGLYDAPDHSKGSSATLHQSVVLSLLGGTREQKDELDTGNGLGLKLEDAWEPPASDDEDEEDDDDEEGADSEEDGEGEGE